MVSSAADGHGPPPRRLCLRSTSRRRLARQRRDVDRPFPRGLGRDWRLARHRRGQPPKGGSSPPAPPPGNSRRPPPPQGKRRGGGRHGPRRTRAPPPPPPS